MKKSILPLCLFTSLLLSAQKPIDKWTTVRFGTLQCDFPKDYSPIQFTGASGVFFDGGNVYLTVTNQPDTSRMKGNLNRDFTSDFMNVVLDVSRKLNGKVREFRDTVIGNMPGYISKLETSFKDGRKSNYELIQVIGQDSLRSFSSQYYIGDKHALKATERFFKSIRVSSNKRVSGGKGKFGIWAGLIVIVAVAAVLASKWTGLKKEGKMDAKKRVAKKK